MLKKYLPTCKHCFRKTKAPSVFTTFISHFRYTVTYLYCKEFHGKQLFLVKSHYREICIIKTKFWGFRPPERSVGRGASRIYIYNCYIFSCWNIEEISSFHLTGFQFNCAAENFHLMPRCGIEGATSNCNNMCLVINY